MKHSEHVNILIKQLLLREGGFVDHPADRGGPTNMGITLDTLAYWRKTPCTTEDVESLTEKEAIDIYYYLYWLKPKFDLLQLHPVVIEALFDTAVHSGPARASKLFQKAVGAKQDGHVGQKTRRLARKMSPTTLAAAFIAERAQFLGRLITKDPSQSVFAAGWMSRIGEFIKQIPNTQES